MWSFCVSRMCHFLSNLVVCCATLKVFLFVCWLVFGFGCLPNGLDYCSSARDWDSWVSGLVCTCKASILYHRMLLGKKIRGNHLEIQFLCRLSWILEEPTEWKEKSVLKSAGKMIFAMELNQEAKISLPMNFSWMTSVWFVRCKKKWVNMGYNNVEDWAGRGYYGWTGQQTKQIRNLFSPWIIKMMKPNSGVYKVKQTLISFPSWFFISFTVVLKNYLIF